MEQSFICVICLESISDSKSDYEFNCFHVFHSECIDKWLEKAGNSVADKSCPVCREEVHDVPNDDIDLSELLQTDCETVDCPDNIESIESCYVDENMYVAYDPVDKIYYTVDCSQVTKIESKLCRIYEFKICNNLKTIRDLIVDFHELNYGVSAEFLKPILERFDL